MTSSDPRAGVLIVQHLPHEGPYAIGTALEAAGLPVRVCRIWAGDPVPESPSELAALVVMGGPMAAYDDSPVLVTRASELALLRGALGAEVPVLGVGLGAQLLAVAAGGAARPGDGRQIGWEEVRTTAAASADPLFAGFPERLRVLHRRGDTLDLPADATQLASCDRYPVQAFRIGGSAWGLRFHLEADKAAVDAFAAAFPDEAAPDLQESAPAELAALAPHRDDVFERFATLVASRATTTTTRAFFTPRAATWEERFAADGPRYAAAVSRMELRPEQRVLDAGCGSGRALPALRAQVGTEGVVLGADLTPAMLTAAAREGRTGLLLADACRLPLRTGLLDGVFSAGLIDHVPDPTAALREWARVTAPGGVLLLFHPSGRAERAARHGRSLDPADLLAEENLRPALHTTCWDLTCYEDAAHHFLARAVRRTG
ncbi:methyltransferase domain-containing protein [Streptomyces luteolifulvus]|uniref:Methyltransferase domain-containing protein n=1 Tax=Streptomyces luteolifulvus TaxID=2615112 RepID=A0A6H9UUY0_9ACTN|nr:methyltransferase domain-containing protein [Streptomyces luteolifulvus]KAB1142350.1 methyltransferase domain-containing protein [Streptomyces luteolifulvus]